jgi:hypothetical protein
MCKRLRKADYDQEIPWFGNSYYKEVSRQARTATRFPSVPSPSTSILFCHFQLHVLNLDYRRERITKEIEGEKNMEPPIESRFKQVAANLWEKKDNQVREFLREQYNGECQICGTTFKKRAGEQYFEGLYMVSHTTKEWIDRPGNVLCLYAYCCAKFHHGPIKSDDIEEQILQFRTFREGGKRRLGIPNKSM